MGQVIWHISYGYMTVDFRQGKYFVDGKYFVNHSKIKITNLSSGLVPSVVWPLTERRLRTKVAIFISIFSKE